MGMSIEEFIERYKHNAEYERTHGNLQGCLEFRQLAEWLEKLQKIQEIVNAPIMNNQADYLRVQSIREVLEDGNDDRTS